MLHEVNKYNVWKHKYYSVTRKSRCGQLGQKITLGKQIRFDCCVIIVPVWFWVTWTQIDRQTKGRMRGIVTLCQNDSVGLLSFSPQPLAEGFHHLNEFRLHNQIKRHLLQLLLLVSLRVSFGFSSVLLSKSVCLISVLLQLVTHHSLLFTQNVAMSYEQRQPTTESWGVILYSYSTIHTLGQFKVRFAS